MNIINLLGAIAAPNDLWSNLITWLQGGIGNIGWAILILTLLVKLVTSPLDFMVKYSTKKQTLIQQKCAPQVAKLQKKFGADQQTLKVQTNALYKREGLNIGTGCIIMLINLVLTCTIFFTFYGSLRTVSAYQAINQYEITYSSYETTFTSHVYDEKFPNDSNYTLDKAKEEAEIYSLAFAHIDEIESDENGELYKAYLMLKTFDASYENTFVNHIYTAKLASDSTMTIERAQELSENFETSYSFINNPENDKESSIYNIHKTVVDNHFEAMQTAANATLKPYIEANEDIMTSANAEASSAALETWNQNKSSWLWVQNIWVADAPTAPFPTFDNLKSTASNAGDYYINYINDNISESDYNTIANFINANSKAENGYYILAILAGVATYLSSLISDLHNKLKNKKANNVATATNPNAAGSMKMMKIIMPIIMIIFVLSSSASFGIYLIASNIAGIAIGELINLIVNKLTKKKRIEVEEYLEKEADRLIRKGKLQG